MKKRDGLRTAIRRFTPAELDRMVPRTTPPSLRRYGSNLIALSSSAGTVVTAFRNLMYGKSGSCAREARPATLPPRLTHIDTTLSRYWSADIGEAILESTSCNSHR